MKLTSMEAGVLLEALPDEDCRLDHNQDCQEHGWFGINGKCPVAASKELISTALKGNPAEPAPVAEPVDTRAYLREKYREELDEWWAEQVAEHNAAHPLLDRAEVKAVLDRRLHGEQVVDAIMALVRPLPTREQIDRTLWQFGVTALPRANGRLLDRDERARFRGDVADAVLALMGGAE